MTHFYKSDDTNAIEAEFKGATVMESYFMEHEGVMYLCLEFSNSKIIGFEAGVGKLIQANVTTDKSYTVH